MVRLRPLSASCASVFWILQITLVVVMVGCKKTNTIASVETTTGSVEHRHLEQPWSKSQIGTKLVPEDWLRTHSASTAVMKLRGGARMTVTPSSTIHFTRTREQLGLNVETGEITLIAGAEPFELSTEIGPVRIMAGSHARLLVVGGQVRVDVMIGAIEFVDEGRVAVPSVDASVPAVDASVEIDTAPAAHELALVGSLGTKDEDNEAVLAALRAGRELSFDLRRGKSARLRSDSSSLEVEGPASGQLRIIDDKLWIRLGTGHVELSGSFSAIVHDVQLASTFPHASLSIRSQSSRASAEVRGGQVDATTSDHSSTFATGSKIKLERGALTLLSAPPTYSHLSLEIGAPAIIHAGDEPVAVKLLFSGRCPHGASVRLENDGLRSEGAEGAKVLLRAGEHEYDVHCLNEEGLPDATPSTSGAILVTSSTLTQSLPKRPGRSVLDADGRRYQVLFQNLLPAFVIRWSETGSKGGTLHVRGKRQLDQEYQGQSISLPSGTLPAGKYRFWIESSDGRQSLESELIIAYDSKASTAQISVPSRQDWSRGQVSFSGSVLPGYQVTIGGAKVPIAKGGRFRATVEVKVDEPTIIELSHPQKTTQYIVRRAP